jgi:hypothetical protein
MKAQREYDFESTPKFDKGEALIEWQGTTLRSPVVVFNRGLLTASYLQQASGTKGGSDNDAFVVSLLEGTPPSSFQQQYQRGDSAHHFEWALIYEGKAHRPRTGSITGTFASAYRSIDAVIHMVFDDNSTANITFKAEKRLQ